MEAIAEVERRQSRGAVFTSYPYASAFFRILNGSKRVTAKDIAWFSLSLSDGWRLFPETKFQLSERRRRQSELNDEKYSRQRRREACQREMAYQALAGQAEIELAFHTPETVSSWISRWSATELRQYDLEDMFWRWSERFPSLEPMERWMMTNQPFWSVMVESDALAKESPESVRQLERWMVPNKLTHRSRV
ncbi:plasmid SOS inhibition protein A (plasmid) [Escherichia coli]|nr:plasmid SOS inhibition protein A [Escherichia coli]MDM4911199.1 plasmid SOS inhibition protein A [Escherichia coli]MDM4916259.1 plasmid SOS inhibition protein A [Escherichia coli]MDM4921513.1 plasmid SOS inhibition protein A [Escherichia coli]MDM4927068.1 plasmid SOS inhibition protein A [Escherichia coli]MDM4956990.1 plasmid SOS inhibition protein A [Escherichia coli]